MLEQTLRFIKTKEARKRAVPATCDQCCNWQYTQASQEILQRALCQRPRFLLVILEEESW